MLDFLGDYIHGDNSTALRVFFLEQGFSMFFSFLFDIKAFLDWVMENLILIAL